MEENNKINMPTLAAAIAYTNSHGGGGGGGTSNYNDLSNKPQIGGTTLTGNKSASDLGLVAAVEGKGLSTNDYTDADKAIVGGVTAALAGKQNVLTEGNNIKIDNNTISVNRWAVPAGKVVYTVITSDENYGQNVHVQRHTLGGALIDDRTFLCVSYTTVDVDDLIRIYNPYASFTITLLKNSDEHQAGYSYTVNPITTPTSNSFTFVMPQEENDNDLIIREELDAVSSAVSAIKDGQSIDSFADVETALAGKQATLTFDSVPTDGSTNPVESNGVYDALALKQNATDNNLQTTDKTVVGAINEHEGDIGSLMSGLTNVDVALSVPENTGKNIIPMSLSGMKAVNTSGTWNDNAYTVNGVTFTVQTDSDGNVTNITVNGTATQNADLLLCDYNTVKSDSYILSGCPSGGSVGTYFMLFGTATQRLAEDIGAGDTFNIASSVNARPAVRILSGYAASNLVFYPMIRPASITDPTYTPYIPSVESRIEAMESGLDDVQGGLSDIVKHLSGIYCYRKDTAGTGASVTFELEDSTRFVALLFYTSNAGHNAIYAISYYKLGQTPVELTKLAGETLNTLAVDNTTGSVSLDMDNWSSAVLLTPNQWFSAQQ